MEEQVIDIKTVATKVGCERASEIELLRQLFETNFSEALKSAAKRGLWLRDAYRSSGDHRHCQRDLNGYILEDVTINSL